MDKFLYYNCLFSIYKDLLTAKEKDIFSLYYEENLSMSEIAELKGITRSAVGSRIKIVENKLTNYESILHIKEQQDKIMLLIANCHDLQLKTQLEDLLKERE